MLGAIRSNRSWRWAAHGKHPAAKDFFSLGRDTPLSRSFSDWVETGYNEMDLKKSGNHDPVAWRFWAGGSRKDVLVCGVVKDSSDNVGRSYPLLIVGDGALKGCKDQWDLLPFACEKTWVRTEYLSARMFTDFRMLENEIQNIRAPYAEWSGFNAKRKELIESGAILINNAASREFAGIDGDLLDKTEGYISLDQLPVHDHFSLIVSLHYILKTHTKGIPNAVFMGGTVDKSYMAFFKRPLLTDDFARLWSVSGSGIMKGG